MTPYFTKLVKHNLNLKPDYSIEMNSSKDFGELLSLIPLIAFVAWLMITLGKEPEKLG